MVKFHIIQILPNIWWAYTSVQTSTPTELSNDNKQRLQKLAKHRNIEQIVSIDDMVAKFWNISLTFTNDAPYKTNIQDNEYKQMLMFLHRIEELINRNFMINKPIIFVTTKFNEVGLAIWLHFLNKRANMNITTVLSLIHYKLSYVPPISENMQRFLKLKYLDNS